MSSLPYDERLTPAEYHALERESEFKHEYIDGYALAMTGASEKHNTITSNLAGIFYNATRKGPCRSFVPDMRVHIAATGNYTYPDLTVVCADAKFLEDQAVATLLNPTLLIEVLSPSTELYDRTTKFHQYQKIASLQDYMLVAQDKPHIDRFSRGDGDTWILTQAHDITASMKLPGLQLTLSLAEVYERVDFA